MLTELPQDLLFAIFDLLQPFEIISIGKTCKVLSYASDQRTVWAAALKKMCTMNKVFLPSFTPDTMSIQELKKTTTTPIRMLALLSSCEMRQDLMLQPVQPRQMFLNKISTVVGKPVLVPGGRFLVVTGRASGEWGVDLLGVWDLHTSSDYSEPVALENFSRRYQSCSIIVAPASGHDAFRIIATFESKPMSNSSIQCAVYEFSSSPTSTHRLICLRSASKTLPGSYFNPILKGNIFAGTTWPFSNEIHLWNFVEDTWAGWLLPDGNYGEIFIDDQYVITLSRLSIIVWELPEFLPWDLYRSGLYEHPRPTPAFTMPMQSLLPALGPLQSRESIFNSRGVFWYHDLPSLYLRSPLGLACFQLGFPIARLECIVRASYMESEPGHFPMDSFILDDHIVRCYLDLRSERQLNMMLGKRQLTTESAPSQNPAVDTQLLRVLRLPRPLDMPDPTWSEYLAYDLAFGRFCFGMAGELGTPKIFVYDLLDNTGA